MASRRWWDRPCDGCGATSCTKVCHRGEWFCPACIRAILDHVAFLRRLPNCWHPLERPTF